MRNFCILLFVLGVFMIESRSLLKECEIKDDRERGCIQKEYRLSGKLGFKIPYKNGMVEGSAEFYYPSAGKLNV